ncbi:VUT family protein [Endozoicomonas sp. Mp262]|uniref:VUT family protein n=1 Tax=Endozoicomonas sp. Mp262 TaxID=2919499 RepID=UPI0021D7FCEB
MKGRNGNIFPEDLETFIAEQRTEALSRKDKEQLAMAIQNHPHVRADVGIFNSIVFSLNSVSPCLLFLSVMFPVMLILMSAVYWVRVELNLGITTLHMGMAGFLYPLSFITLDTITENYGRYKARTVLYSTCVFFLLSAGLLKLGMLLATEIPANIEKLPTLLLSHGIGLFIVDRINISLFTYLRKLTENRNLILRSFVSSALCSSLYLAMASVMVYKENALTPEITTLLYESVKTTIIFLIFYTPLFYLMVRTTKHIDKTLHARNKERLKQFKKKQTKFNL